MAKLDVKLLNSPIKSTKGYTFKSTIFNFQATINPGGAFTSQEDFIWIGEGLAGLELVRAVCSLDTYQQDQLPVNASVMWRLEPTGGSMGNMQKEIIKAVSGLINFRSKSLLVGCHATDRSNDTDFSCIDGSGIVIDQGSQLGVRVVVRLNAVAAQTVTIQSQLVLRFVIPGL